MATVMTIAIGVLALLVFLLFGGVLELYRDVRQLREVAGILDRPLDVDIGDVAGTRPSRYGLPEVLDTSASALVLFLSDRCATCRSLAAGFGGSVPTGLWVVLEARTPTSAEEFLASSALDPRMQKERLLVDVAGRVVESLGLRTTPVVFRVEDGRFASATTAPSRRYLSSIIPTRVLLDRSTPRPEKKEERRAS